MIKNKKPQQQMPESEARVAEPSVTEHETGGEAHDEKSAAPTIEELQQKLAEAEERCLRAKADRENHRKRMQRELADIRQQVKAYTVQEFLPVFDSFQMALSHACEGAEQENLKQGLEMIDNEFKRTLDNLGVACIQAAGQPFDPNEHEAITQEPSEEIPEGHVLRQWKCGFRLGERMLRPATVVVSSGQGTEGNGNKKSG